MTHIVFFAMYLFWQNPPPLVVKRTPSNLPEADIKKAVDLLSKAKDAPPADQPQAQPVVAQQPDIQKAPRGYKPATDVRLDEETKKALSMAKAWQDKPATPVEDSDGRLHYTYGAGLPVIVCAPLRLTAIELQPGETLKANQGADQQRWDIFPLLAGEQTIVILRPKAVALDTTLLLLTDRHKYYLRIVSKSVDYMARVVFDYPDSSDDKWREYEVTKAAEAEKHHEAAEEAARPVEVWTAGYALQGKKSFWGHESHPYFWPTQVKHNDKLVRIDLPEGVASSRMPALVKIGSSGKQEPINYSVDGTTIIARSLFARAMLIQGSGKKAQTVTITSPGAAK